ncbi:hypothetical protein AUEXF2481DRAFT_25826 [Aureobasidium subglaciale EXF-2481]|uniref:Extracellular membrane protein CFEM domain-containing protein n=1 Tax=Aureobasidium subglaciale (strain EXF-2481) TaxID=1043005 RepID=A0A074Z0Q2_AURSE|nr:uncharacterized protein AUEXF2481DRAFT_25826 [Aureobasidium subglaciale EXF-2481]KAI5211447.1 hypothetical protein E4T38_01377 [Aureobasidium subglaciale]KAI5229755.1 hypothetical protein E4T40_01378 [Aureobasidium subglaciale]KAI5233440.1 hypothetical protein E4T41_01376 [Aureobasidium subglaciale]KAI5266646.1 hypothetical protein E4T46_01377 [Aureobasidium subglaciale]KEQ99952.1 hypothetical protein AUEXF2481DRAFT_25826 [Aureobasidium subglaciale EXF-2481]
MIAGYTLVGCFAALSAVAHAQEEVPQEVSIFDLVNTPFTFTDCAAPSEMQTCWESQNFTNEYLDPFCLGTEERIKCALTSCWNRVYSCDYQQLLMTYNTSCSDAFDEGVVLDLPFYPPPAKAAGECSCNINALVTSLEKSGTDGYIQCMEEIQKERGETDDEEEQPTPDCDCCFYGIAAATTYDTCPDADPGPIVLNALQQQYIDSTRRGNNNSLSQCASRLANFNCVDYGFTEYANNASDYARLTPLHSATGTFSDVNGVLTSPVSGATYTWTAWNMTYTITAASVEAVATRTASATGKISGSVTGSVTGTAIGAPSTNTGAAAPTLIAVQYPAAALMGLSGLALALL